MASRSYRQICSVSKALDLVGERWTLLIVRDLLPGPLGYMALLEGLPGLTTNLLAKRLKDLAAAGLIERSPAPTKDKSKALYSLTVAGRALAPVIAALAQWGREYGPAPGPGDAHSFRLLLLLFRQHYVQQGGRWIVQLDCGEESLQLRLGGPEFEGVAATPMRPDLIVKGDVESYSSLLFDEDAADALVRSGRIQLQPGPTGEEPLPIWADFLASLQLGHATRSS